MVTFWPHFCKADSSLIAILIFHNTGIKAALFLKAKFFPWYCLYREQSVLAKSR